MNKRLNFKDSKILVACTRFLNQNGPTLAMGGAIVMLGVALYAAFKASDEVSEITKKSGEDMVEVLEKGLSEADKAKEIKDIKVHRNIHYIYAYRKALICGVISALLTFLSNYLNGVIISGLTAALALKNEKVQEYLENAKQVLGEDKFKEIDEKINKKIVDDLPWPEDCVLKEHEHCGQAFRDKFTHSIFYINKEDLTKVLEHAEDYCSRNHGLPISKYCEFLGLPVEEGYGNLWWGPNRPFKPHITTVEKCGMLMETIGYQFDPTDIKTAGVPSGWSTRDPSMYR